MYMVGSARWDSWENEILHMEFCLICIWKWNSILETYCNTTFLIQGHFDTQKWSFKFGWKYREFSKFTKVNKFRPVFFIFKQRLWLLRSRRSFRHQGRPNWLMSYFQKTVKQNVSKIEFHFQIHMRQNSRRKISFLQESHRALVPMAF